MAINTPRPETAREALRKIHAKLESFIQCGDDDPDHRVGDSYLLACETLGEPWRPTHRTDAKQCLYCLDMVPLADVVKVGDVGPFCADCAALSASPATPERLFPIQGGPAIPWRLIAPFEAQAQKNHSQSLERLAERGGLDPTEALAILHGEEYYKFWTARLGRRVPSKDCPPHADVLRELLDLIAVRSASPATGEADKVEALLALSRCDELDYMQTYAPAPPNGKTWRRCALRLAAALRSVLPAPPRTGEAPK